MSESGERLTEEEAKQFLELLERVDEDMNEASRQAFDDDISPEEFEETWNGTAGTVYTNAIRGKYRSFIERVYLD